MAFPLLQQQHIRNPWLGTVSEFEQFCAVDVGQLPCSEKLNPASARTAASASVGMALLGADQRSFQPSS